MRPGVPTTTSTPRCSASICGSYARPPYTCTTRTLRCRAAVVRSPATCTASSRVGATTSACGLPASGRESQPSSPGPTTRSSSGIPKPGVLPVPVLAGPVVSRPARATGRVSAWIGNGWVMPTSASARTIGSETPRSAKVAGDSACGSGISTSVVSATTPSRESLMWCLRSWRGPAAPCAGAGFASWWQPIAGCRRRARGSADWACRSVSTRATGQPGRAQSTPMAGLAPSGAPHRGAGGVDGVDAVGRRVRSDAPDRLLGERLEHGGEDALLARDGGVDAVGALEPGAGRDPDSGDEVDDGLTERADRGGERDDVGVAPAAGAVPEGRAGRGEVLVDGDGGEPDQACGRALGRDAPELAQVGDRLAGRHLRLATRDASDVVATQTAEDPVGGRVDHRGPATQHHGGRVPRETRVDDLDLVLGACER